MSLHRSDLKLGMFDANEPLVLPASIRDEHTYICGSTGTGKSKMLEHLIRQDMVDGPENRSGMLVRDPRGSLYDGLINWLPWKALNVRDIPIVPIDLRSRNQAIGYNVLRRRPDTHVRHCHQLHLSNGASFGSSWCGQSSANWTGNLRMTRNN